jgi:hypothetical protein
MLGFQLQNPLGCSLILTQYWMQRLKVLGTISSHYRAQ